MDEGVESGGPDDATAMDAAAADPLRFSPLLSWALAAFHAALLVALAVAVLFALGLAGNQLAALETSVGVAAYCYLWAVTWWTNRRVVESVGSGLVTGSADSSAVLVEAMKWGGVVGLLVFLPALVIGIVLFVGAGGIEAVPFLLVAAVVGGVLAGGVGVVVGALYALLDLVLVRLAHAWLPAGDPSVPSDA